MANIVYRSPSGMYMPRDTNGRWAPRQVVQRPGEVVTAPAAAPADQPQRTILAPAPQSGAVRILAR